MMYYSEKHKIMSVKKWLSRKPQFRALYCPNTFMPMARRLFDGKDFLVGSTVSNGAVGIIISTLESDMIHIGIVFIEDNSVGMIEINKLP